MGAGGHRVPSKLAGRVERLHRFIVSYISISLLSPDQGYQSGLQLRRAPLVGPAFSVMPSARLVAGTVLLRECRCCEEVPGRR